MKFNLETFSFPFLSTSESVSTEAAEMSSLNNKNVHESEITDRWRKITIPAYNSADKPSRTSFTQNKFSR